VALRYAQIGVVSFALALGVIGSVQFGLWLVDLRALMTDFTVFWTAARVEHVYDAVALTAAQAGLPTSGHGLRPFPYPPPAVLLISPLRLFDYYAAAIGWTIVGVTAFAVACRLYGRAALLALFSPMVGIALATGQMSLLLGAGVGAGIGLLDRRPILAGSLLGLVGAIKPQLVALVPLGLMFGGHWRSLLAACVSGLAAIAFTLPLGPALWFDWVHSIPAFATRAVSPEFARMNMSPGIWFAPLGVVTVAYVFRMTREIEIRLLALGSAACLCVPYMLIYDLAVIAPAAAALMFKPKPLQWGLGSIAFALPWTTPLLACGAILLARARALPTRESRHESATKSMV
jgi:hypothetical protein